MAEPKADPEITHQPASLRTPLKRNSQKRYKQDDGSRTGAFSPKLQEFFRVTEDQSEGSLSNTKSKINNNIIYNNINNITTSSREEILQDANHPVTTHARDPRLGDGVGDGNLDVRAKRVPRTPVRRRLRHGTQAKGKIRTTDRQQDGPAIHSYLYSRS